MIGGLIFGLISGLHCAGMCGPLALMHRSNTQGSAWNFFIQYHLGRILVYILIGALVMMLGASLDVFRFQQIVSVLTGSALVLFSLFTLLGTKKQLAEKVSQKIFGKAFRNLFNKFGHLPFASGMINGLLPCGAVYVAAAYALTLHSFTETAIYMGLFGVGTLPVFISIWIVAKQKLGLSKSKIMLVYKLLPVIIGALMIMRGANMGIKGISPAAHQEAGKLEINQCCEDESQSK